MKRRDFLKNSALLGAAAGTSGVAAMTSVSSCSTINSSTTSKYIEYKGKEAEGTLLEVFENEYLRYELNDNASARVIDKRNGNFAWDFRPVALQELGEIEEGHVWLRNERTMCEEYPGHFVLEKCRDGIKASLIGRENRYWGSFVFQVKLDNQWLNFTIKRIDDSIPSLSFPSSIECDELVLPKGIGQILPAKGNATIFSRYIYTFFTHLNMRWIGGQKDGHAWIAIFDEGFEDAAALMANGAIAPVYMRSLNQWRHGYTMKYTFVKGDYVALAKTYRQWFTDQGWFNPLTEKIKRTPRLNGFLGGRGFWISMAHPGYSDKYKKEFFLSDEMTKRRPDDVMVHRTYSELETLIGQLKDAGLKRGYIKIAGWINRGYDASHPDVWPPEPKLGDVSELKKILEQKDGIVTGLHDNNMDMYETVSSFPNGINRLKDGSLMIGGGWAGGQAYIMHMKHGFEYGKRNWEKIKTLDPTVMFVDTTTAMQLYQSYENPALTKADDLEAKQEMIKFYKDEGTIFGSEEIADFAIPGIDFYENRHQRIQGQTIPLWPLVFHDAAFCMTYGSSEMNGDHPRWLEMMQWGYMMHYTITDEFDFDLFKKTFHVDDWHAQIGMAEMTDHKFLNKEKTLEMSSFGNGKSIICNYGQKPELYNGKTIQPAGYLIIG
ncbi:MAG: DUF5696 domain-containing protein [Bacteroidales bacterium]|nr:DUF5696 domain-containing protein [Bacteroidales bacterium]